MTTVGKRVHGSIYVHQSALHLLPDDDCAIIAQAEGRFDGRPWNVARFGKGSVTLLDYPLFDTQPFPTLAASYRYDVEMERTCVRTYDKGNPPVLHRKELLVARDDERVTGWAELTKKLVDAGAFRDGSRIGRKNAWRLRLMELGLDEAELCHE